MEDDLCHRISAYERTDGKLEVETGAQSRPGIVFLCQSNVFSWVPVSASQLLRIKWSRRNHVTIGLNSFDSLIPFQSTGYHFIFLLIGACTNSSYDCTQVVFLAPTRRW